MRVKFIARDPGHHRQIGEEEMDTIPGVGEYVVVGVGENEHPPRQVYEVTWFVSHKFVEVLLR